MNKVTITLPFPPSVNTYYAVVRGRKILSKKGREYKKETFSLIAESGSANRAMTGRLQVAVRLTPPDRRSRDIDNYCKALLDAITNAGVWGDDSQIKRIVIDMAEPAKPGMAEVSITALPE